MEAHGALQNVMDIWNTTNKKAYIAEWVADEDTWYDSKHAPCNQERDEDRAENRAAESPAEPLFALVDLCGTRSRAA